ncbi:MAG TPA: helix-turn-helix domain-containing protein [Gemmatimonadaceae bacterium]|nr:helix-turn-helix domain-containing protein [Gemmatimonadaceae bacterium]
MRSELASSGPSRGTSPGGRTDGAADHPADTLTIGELARRTGVSAETIRYYEREGVVPPASRAGAGRYRRYVAADAERLRFVRRARELGFGLDEVRELLALAAGDPRRPCDEVDRIALAHLRAVEAKLAELARLRDELVRVIASCRGGDAVAACRILGALGAP